MKDDVERIKEEFTKNFIEAISSQSIEACADLVLNDEDNAILEIDYGLSKEEYRKRLMIQSENFLKENKKFIDRKNAKTDAAITYGNVGKVNMYDFEIPQEHPACFIKTISISMRERLVDGVFYQVGFQIDDALFVNGKIKINNLHSIRMYESFWDEINEENTPYPKVESKEKLRSLMTEHLNKEYSLILNNYNDWYYHEGDLELDRFDLKVNFIVTGNLTIKENVVEINHELIVLGKTKLNALHLDEDNDVLFLGGIEFKTGVFILSSGAFQVLKQPNGPFLYTYSESIDIDNKKGIQCYVNDAMGQTHGNCLDLLSEKFMEKEEDIFELDTNAMIEAIRNGENIFK